MTVPLGTSKVVSLVLALKGYESHTIPVDPQLVAPGARIEHHVTLRRLAKKSSSSATKPSDQRPAFKPATQPKAEPAPTPAARKKPTRRRPEATPRTPTRKRPRDKEPVPERKPRIEVLE